MGIEVKFFQSQRVVRGNHSSAFCGVQGIYGGFLVGLVRECEIRYHCGVDNIQIYFSIFSSWALVSTPMYPMSEGQNMLQLYSAVQFSEVRYDST